MVCVAVPEPVVLSGSITILVLFATLQEPAGSKQLI